MTRRHGLIACGFCLLWFGAPAHADVAAGGAIIVPTLDNGQPAAGKSERIPIETYSWEGTTKEDVAAEGEIRAGLVRVAPRGHAGELIISKNVELSSPLASYCQQKTPLKEVLVVTPNWRRFPDRQWHYRTYKLTNVVVDKCGYMSGAVDDTYHLSFSGIEEIPESKD